MATIIMKESRDSDYYIGWSTVADGITFGGTRDEAIEHLWSYVVQTRRREDVQPEERRHPENLLQRCDIFGTSSYFEYEPDRYEGGWDDSGFVYDQKGWASRENVFAIARRMDADQPWFDLLRPFDD